MKQVYKCDWCGKEFKRYPSQVNDRKMLFCSRNCLARYRSKEFNPDGRPIIRHPHLSEYNRKHNPERMSEEVKSKLMLLRIGSGDGKTYVKVKGRHLHRQVAEEKLGRKLLPGEVVHHINGDKRDNRPENITVFPNQAEHARWHMEHKKGGDAQ